MLRFVHTSDWQVGMKGGGLGAAGGLVAQQRVETIDRVLAIAEQHQASFVLAAGDLFEDNKVSQEVVDCVAALLRAHPGIEVHAIPGNHDLPGPGSVWSRAALRGVPNLTCHTDSNPIALGPDATLHPFPVKSRYAGSDPLEGLEELFAQPGIHVGLAHGHLSIVQFGGHEQDVRLPIDPVHVSRAGLDYLALGHWHGTQLFKASDGHLRIAYSGTHEQTAHSENDAGNVLVVEIDEKGAPPRIEKVRSGQLRWAKEQLTLAGETSTARVKAVIEACTADLMLLQLGGELPSALDAAYRELMTEGKGRFKDLRVDDRELRWRVEEDPAAAPQISDASLNEVAAELRRRMSESTGRDGEIAREAWYQLRTLLQEAGL
jgi:DNA repair exonuclease SbcCD nuclease subunit